jgi:hypothetical protein
MLISIRSLTFMGRLLFLLTLTRSSFIAYPMLLRQRFSFLFSLFCSAGGALLGSEGIWTFWGDI